MKQGQRKERTIGLAGRVEKVMGDILKILTECSFDNLFVLTGLAFTGIAIVGNVWRIQPGKWGRLGSATLGLMLICAGLWIHMHQHSDQFKVVHLDFQAASNAYEGACPIELKFPGQIEASGSGTIRYEVEYSDGTKTFPLHLDFEHPETKHINIDREFHQSRSDAWAKLKILSPGNTESEKAFFAVTCQGPVVTKARLRRGKPADGIENLGPRTEIASAEPR